MKALVYTAPGECIVREEPEPDPAPGEVLVHIEAVGICGSDMHAWHGHDPRRKPPLILGHEAAGTVIDGNGSGRRVALNPLIVCGQCHHCRTGRGNLCPSRDLIGMRRPGAFAERVAIPESNLIDIPDDMPTTVAALAEPCATAWHAVTLARRVRSRPLAEAVAQVIGGGAVGLLTALILRHCGVAEVRLAETNPRRLKTVNEAGITGFDPLAGDQQTGACDLVFDAVGSARTRAAAIAATAPGGVIVHIGLQDAMGDFDARTLTLGEIAFLGAYTYTDADFRASLNALARGALGDTAWVEERPLADGGRAFEELDRGLSAGAKVMLRP